MDEQSKVRRDKLQKLRDQGRAYPHSIKVGATAKDVLSRYGEIHDANILTEAGSFSLAGRVNFIRSFGKAGFVKIRDRSGTLQLHFSKDKCDERSFEDFKSLDLGDLVRAEGVLFRTKTGELSLDLTKFQILVKCLHTPPEKFHGLTDVEERYRKRYLDLMSNEDSRRVFEIRSKIVQGVRNYFTQRDFVEVETPMMHPLVSGAAARPFVTHHNTLDMKLFLRIAPELYLKRLVVGGFERVFEINRNFRNEGISIRHNPEFTMLEFYMCYATYEDLMNMTEEMVEGLVSEIHGKMEVEYQGDIINFKGPWKRITMEEAVQTHSGYKGAVNDADSMRAYLKSKSIEVSGREGVGGLLSKIFDEECDSKLIQPTFVVGYPVEVSPLARRSDQKSPSGLDITDRFELFIHGKEIANGFNELNDPDDQKARFEAQLSEKDAGNLEATDYDADYIQALEYGLAPTAGEGIGIDRLTMLLTNAASIRDVIFFPQLRNNS
jgi:lysyl-tRNA synthetase class 2